MGRARSYIYALAFLYLTLRRVYVMPTRGSQEITWDYLLARFGCRSWWCQLATPVGPHPVGATRGGVRKGVVRHTSDTQLHV